MTKIFRLIADCNNDLVLRTDLEYFRNHFIGLPMQPGWIPPDITIVDAHKRSRDFVSWMLSAPVVSEKGKKTLGPLIGFFTEFLPLIEIRGAQYYAMNVTTMVDCLDLDHSDVLYAPDNENEVLCINTYRFIDEKLCDYPIFKVKEWPTDVLVSESFVEHVKKSGLKGADFVDASIDPFDAL